jgi:hypothetical protein
MSYYIYTLSEPDMDEFGSSQVFYVGKGCGKRVGDHEQEARKGKRSAKCDRIRAIWAAGKQVQKRIIFDTEDEAEAYRYEVQLIASIGRDNLTNGNDGGPLPCQADQSPRPHRPISLMNAREYRHFLSQQKQLTSKNRAAMMERWYNQRQTNLEAKLRAAYHNRRLNGWDTTEEIAQLESDLEEIYVALGCAFQDTLF